MHLVHLFVVALLFIKGNSGGVIYYKYCNGEGWTFEYVKGAFTFDEAKAECEKRRSTLATINDAEDQHIVHEITVRQPGSSCEAYDTKSHCSAWIGLRRISPSSNIFQWQKGSSSYRNFYAGQPDNHGGKEACVHINAKSNGQWNDMNCDERYGAICKRRSVIPKRTNSAGEVLEYLEGAFTFDEAKVECLKRLATLATIINAEDQKLAHEISVKQPGQTCKAYDTKSHCSAWIGLRRIFPSSNIFKWQKGSSTYRNFYTNQPDNSRGKEACVHMNAKSNGKWNDMKCAEKMGAICKRSSVTPMVC